MVIFASKVNWKDDDKSYLIAEQQSYIKSHVKLAVYCKLKLIYVRSERKGILKSDNLVTVLL